MSAAEDGAPPRATEGGGRWLLPIAALAILAQLVAMRQLAAPLWLVGLLTAAALLGLAFFGFMLLTRLAARGALLERRHRELAALHEAGMAVSAELSLDAVLQKVVDISRRLVDARYGALAVYGEDGALRHFVTSGITAEDRELIGDPPSGRGLLGLVLERGERLRLDDMTKHPGAHGLPPGHPPMHSLLAVPIYGSGLWRGNLYLTEKRGPEKRGPGRRGDENRGTENGIGRRFSADDEATLLRFATQAAIAVDNAQLHERTRALAAVEERLRLSQEMHEGVSQVLAYVNAKAQAVGEYLRVGKGEEAEQQLDQLASAAREVYADVKEAIFSLRYAAGVEGDLTAILQGYLEAWQDRTGVMAELTVEGTVETSPAIEAQLIRIVQEALANVRKHSKAEHAQVLLRQNGIALSVEIADDGQGFETGRGVATGRYGLATMRERARSVGGELELESEPGQGTRVLVHFPRPVTPASGND